MNIEFDDINMKLDAILWDCGEVSQETLFSINSVPEKSLLAAIVVRALLDLKSDEESLRVKAYQFFLDPGSEHDPFSLNWICSNLSIPLSCVCSFANKIHDDDQVHPNAAQLRSLKLVRRQDDPPAKMSK